MSAVASGEPTDSGCGNEDGGSSDGAICTMTSNGHWQQGPGRSPYLACRDDDGNERYDEGDSICTLSIGGHSVLVCGRASAPLRAGATLVRPARAAVAIHCIL